MGWGPIRNAIIKAAAVANNVRDAVNTPDTVSATRQALAATPDGDKSSVLYMHQLAVQLASRYQAVGATADFAEASQLCQQVLQLTDLKDTHRTDTLHTLSCLLGYRHQRTRQTADLNQAIEYSQELLQVPALDAAQRASAMNHLALCLKTRFQEQASTPDIVEAVHFAREASVTCPEGDTNRTKYLDDLALLLFENYAAMHTRELLAEAMSVAHRAILDSPQCESARMVLLTHLAKAHHLRYQRRGDVSDLEMAIRLHEKAKGLARPNSPEATSRSYSLGAVYLDRFRRTQSGADLKVAMKEASLAVHGTLADHSERADRLVGLGIVYHESYLRTGITSDLEEATRLFQAAVDGTGPTDAGWPGHVHHLGGAHLDRYIARTPGSSWELAARLVREAVHLTPADHLDRPSRLETLAHVYKARLPEDASSSDMAIQLFQEAANASPPGHKSRASRLHNMGLEYESRYRKFGSPTDLTTATRIFHDALHDPWSNIHARLAAGKDLTFLLAHAGDWNGATETAEVVINLMPSLTPLSLGYADKKRLLSQFGNFASDAAAIALNAGQSPFQALQLLELGRGILAGSLSELYTDVSELSQRHPDIAARYTRLRNEVDNRARSAETPRVVYQGLPDFTFASTAKIQANKFYEAGKAFEGILAEIRNLPGFQDFLLPPNEHMVKGAAEQGPLIAINASRYRCDAILVTKNEIMALPLPSLQMSEIEGRIRRGEIGRLSTLSWLWKTVASPILDALGYTQPFLHHDSGSWPHVWWIPTGSLAKFPLHAAGVYEDLAVKMGQSSSGPILNQTVLDRVMSSYSTSIKTIIHIRSDSSTAIMATCMKKFPGKAILLAMEITPNQPRLPRAKSEISQLIPLCTSMNLEPVIPVPLKEGVMSDLASGRCRIFHFAGHGHTNPVDALESYLCLGDSSTSQYGIEYERLKVADLWKLNLRDDGRPPPFLAYLSACSTGGVEDARSAQESIHLIGSFQGAGFRHVIGTLWEVNDALCVDMARLTYEELSKGNGENDEAVCKGLHMAMRELRGRWLQKMLGRVETIEETNSSRSLSQDGLPRKVMLCDDSDEEDGEATDMPFWIPYVHFGV
ncbi:CHAT domain containing protein [Rhypophila decipiens]